MQLFKKLLKVAVIGIILGLIGFYGVAGAIHQVDKLYLEPDEKSTVTWVFPPGIQVYVMDVQESWMLIRICWDIRILAWQSKGQSEGWIRIKKGVQNGS
jgi:hypothetical protein